MTTCFTICATNYLAFARRLGESVLREHPGATFTIWCLDREPAPSLPEGFRLRHVDELLSDDERERLRFYYDLLELATAVKPLCFQRHFEEGAPDVVYLDPDILLFRPLTAVEERLAAGAPIVLTPHVMAPLPQDDAIPDDLVLLQAGIYNLGFLALRSSSEARELLEWWWGWLRSQCFADKALGTFTDQKWLNFAPLFWPDTAIVRDPTYNVAYWNLPQRRLERDGDDYTVDGQPLTFFHFSGFDPRQPGVLSKHQTRIDVGRKTALATILADYAEAVLAAGHEELSARRPPPVTFANGVTLDPVARAVFRDAMGRGMSFSDPVATGIGSFYRWLTGPVPRDLQSAGSPTLTRYLLKLYELREDVRQTFPDVYGADRAGFLDWARRQAVPEMGSDPRLVGAADDPRPAAPASEPPTGDEGQPAVRLVGYLKAALGLGEAARGYARAMDAAGIALRYTDATQLTASPIDPAVALPPESGPEEPPIHVIHVNADQLPRLREQAGTDLFDGRYTVGIWAWETQKFPAEWHDRFDLLDEIWVPSAFIADAVAAVSPIPVLRIPHAIEVPEVEPDRARFGFAPDECVFLFTFDFHSTMTRKNPLATIEAFRRAFGPDDPVRLVLKSLNSANCPEDRATLEQAAAGLRVTFIDEALDGESRHVLLASCDCFVSLHRAEGFGLGLAEAMALGKPVIATGWSGNMDFMSPSNSYPVDYVLRPLSEEAPPYPAGTIWAEPDVDHAARAMRDVAGDRDARATIGNRARRDIEAGCDPAVVGRLIRSRLERLRGLGRPPRPAAAPAQPPTAPPALQARSLAYRGLRGAWRLALRLAPDRYHPRLHRMTSRLRGFLAVG